MLHSYDDKSSPNQQCVDNDVIMAILFIGPLKGVASNWFKSLSNGFINSWDDLETRFLSRFYEDDTEVTMDKLLPIVKKEESL